MRGVTLIEATTYMALLSLLLPGTILTAFNYAHLVSLEKANSELLSEAIFYIEKIKYSANSRDGVEVVNNSILFTDSNLEETKFYLEGTELIMHRGENTLVLTKEKIQVDQLSIAITDSILTVQLVLKTYTDHGLAVVKTFSSRSFIP